MLFRSASNTGDDPGVEALVEAVQPSGLPARHRLDGPRTMNASPMELRTGTDITKAEIHVMPSIAYLVGRLFFVITLYRRTLDNMPIVGKIGVILNEAD